MSDERLQKTQKNSLFAVTLDGTYTQSDAQDLVNMLEKHGFSAHIAEI